MGASRSVGISVCSLYHPRARIQLKELRENGMTNDLKRVPGFTDYACDIGGNVWSFKTTKGLPIPHKITPRIRLGYGRIALLTEGKPKYYDVHRLMALTFLGEPPTPKSRVLHWDDDRQNNRLNNLRWGSHAENLEDARRNGRSLAKPNRKLSADQVREIRTRKLSIKKYAEKFAVTTTVITLAQNYATYKEVV